MERNYKRYFDTMSQSMQEKTEYILEDLCSITKIGDKGLVVDFGGANGELLSLIKNTLDYEVTNNYIYIVIEKKEVIDIVEPGFQTDGITFMTLEDFHIKYKNSSLKRYVIFSSVLHELFSVGNPTVEDVQTKYFTKLLTNTKRVYIRDMYFEGSLGDLDWACRTKAMDKYHNKYNEYMGCTKVPSDEKLFEFLMKTRYLNHWEQEKKEYYFSVPYINMIEHFTKYNLHTLVVKKYRNEHIIDEIEDRFNWTDQFEEVKYTHIKMIFSKF